MGRATCPLVDCATWCDAVTLKVCGLTPLTMSLIFLPGSLATLGRDSTCWRRQTRRVRFPMGGAPGSQKTQARSGEKGRVEVSMDPAPGLPWESVAWGVDTMRPRFLTIHRVSKARARPTASAMDGAGVAIATAPNASGHLSMGASNTGATALDCACRRRRPMRCAGARMRSNINPERLPLHVSREPRWQWVS